MSHSHIQSCHEPPPSTPNMWLREWIELKAISVPSKSGLPISLDIANIQPVDDPDFLVSTQDGKRFYVEFQRSSTFRARDLPTLVVPDCKLDKAWWLLPNV